MSYKPIFCGDIVKFVEIPTVAPINEINIGKKVDIEKKDTCLNGYFKQTTYRVQNGDDISLGNYLKTVSQYIIKSLELNAGTKVVLGITTNMRQGDVVEQKYFKTYPHLNYAWRDKQKLFRNLYSQLLSVYNNTDFEGSGWSLMGNAHVSVNYGKYQPFKGGCSTVELPKWLSAKKGTISMIAGDNRCFYWNVLRFFNPIVNNKGRVDKNLRKIFNEEPHRYADFTGVSYPTSSGDIEVFQKKNPHIYLLVYGVDEKKKLTPLIYDGKKHV